MALQALGSRLGRAISQLNERAVVDDETVQAVLKEVCTALVEADVNVRLISGLRQGVLAKINGDDIPAANMARVVERALIDGLVKMLNPGKEPYKMKRRKANVVMFVGLQGAGKTTTIGKYAYHYKQKRWKTAMVCADTFRAGAFDQLKQNAQKVHVPYYGSYDEPDPVKIARDGVDLFRREGFEVIIVDTSGRHKQEAALFEEMVEVARAVKPDEVVFVMDSSIGQAAEAQARAFSEYVDVGSVIITKLDGHAKGGGALSAVAATGSPITFIGTGEHFADLDRFDATAFISKLIGRGDMRGLVEKVQGAMDEDVSKRMMANISKGKFTMRNLYEQLQQLQSMGPLGKLLEMMPGNLSQLAQASGRDPSDNVKRWLCMMDSMTTKELDGVVEVVGVESRIQRIARGAGVHPQEVQGLFTVYKQFGSMVGKLGKNGLFKSDSNMLQQMSRNKKGVAKALSQAVDPSMLARMGGADNLMQMMQGMAGGGGGMPDLSKMMGSLMGGGAGGNPLAAMMGGGRGMPGGKMKRVRVKKR